MHFHRKSWAFCDPGKRLTGHDIKDRFPYFESHRRAVSDHGQSASVALGVILKILQYHEAKQTIPARTFSVSGAKFSSSHHSKRRR